jgi:hypothetical protein
VTGSPPPRDWDKELAEIDKLIAKQPVPAPGAPPAAQRAAPGAPAARALPPPPLAGRRAALGTWVKAALGVTVAAGVGLSWPYAHACGLSLYGYLAASIGVVLAGLWGATSSWRHRIAAAHLISLLVILSGGLLLAKTILDRTTYPRTPSTWSCPVRP